MHLVTQREPQHDLVPVSKARETLEALAGRSWIADKMGKKEGQNKVSGGPRVP